MILEIVTTIVFVILIVGVVLGEIDLLSGIAIYIALRAILWGVKNMSMGRSNPFGDFGFIMGFFGFLFGIVLIYKAKGRISLLN